MKNENTQCECVVGVGHRLNWVLVGYVIKAPFKFAWKCNVYTFDLNLCWGLYFVLVVSR